MATDCVGFQAQIASIVEILANSAVAEICRLVEEGYEALRSQMEQERAESQRQNEALRHKLRQMDAKVRSSERKMRRRSMSQIQQRLEENHLQRLEENHLQRLEENHLQRLEENHLQRLEENHLQAAHYGPGDVSEDIVPVTVGDEDQTFPHISMEEDMSVVKEEQLEKDECDLDLKVEVNIRAECGLSNALESNDEASTVTENVTPPSSQPAPPSDATIDLTCRPRAKRKSTKPVASSKTPENCVKPEVQVIEDVEDEDTSPLSAPPPSDTSPERLSSLALDLAWMQERVTHLGAAYAVAQLGLGNSDSGHASFQAPASGDSLDGPPTMIFSSSAHDMAAFAASFDMSAAQNTPAATSQPAPSQAPPPSSSYRGAKEPAACAVCGRVFPSAATLELHQRVHSGERPYTCPHCGKGFAQPNNLRVHLLIHTGERRYRCTLCAKSFISSSHLKRHRTVHTQEKPYSCARCGQSFSQMCSVRRHRQQSQCGLEAPPPPASVQCGL